MLTKPKEGVRVLLKLDLPKVVIAEHTDAILFHNLHLVRRHFKENFVELPPMPFVKQCIFFYVFSATEEGISSKQTREYINRASLGVADYPRKIDEVYPAIVLQWIFIYLAIMDFIFESFCNLGIQDFYVEPLDAYINCVLDEGFNQEQVWLDCFHVACGDVDPHTLNSHEPLSCLYKSIFYTKDQPQCLSI